MATQTLVTILPKDRNLFAERATLKLLELSRGYEGVKSLRHMERARRFRSLFGDFKDASASAVEDINDLDDAENLEDQLVKTFWNEMGRQVIMPEVQARITIGLPKFTKSNALCAFELDISDNDIKEVTLSYLKMASYELKGVVPNFADDIAIFDLKPTEINPNPIDLRPYSQFITAGTTISFYYPAVQHEEWFIFARPYRIPPDFILDKRLQVIYAKPISVDVNVVIYGVEAISLKT